MILFCINRLQSSNSQYTGKWSLSRYSTIHFFTFPHIASEIIVKSKLLRVPVDVWLISQSLFWFKTINCVCLYQRDEAHIVASEMKFLSGIIGYTRLDKISNDTIRKSVSVQKNEKIKYG